MVSSRETTLVLFDIDGTLTKSRKVIKPEMKAHLKELSKHATLGIVGGSDYPKAYEQLDKDDELLSHFDFLCPENGLTAWENGKQLESQSIKKFLGVENIKKFVNFCLHYMADLDIPVKTGTFLEFRNGLINVCPVGRNCSQEERDAFEQFDKKEGIRTAFVLALKKEFESMGLKYSIGGQISFDVFPIGWDKTFCLRHVKQRNFKEINFFGDKTHEGGNDFEIFSHPDVVGHTVTSPEDTIEQTKKFFA